MKAQFGVGHNTLSELETKNPSHFLTPAIQPSPHRIPTNFSQKTFATLDNGRNCQTTAE